MEPVGIHIVNNSDPTRMYDCYLVGTNLLLTHLGVYKESKYMSGVAMILK